MVVVSVLFVVFLCLLFYQQQASSIRMLACRMLRACSTSTRYRYIFNIQVDRALTARLPTPYKIAAKIEYIILRSLYTYEELP